MNAQSGRALLEEPKTGHEAVMRLLLRNKADFNLLSHHIGKRLPEIQGEDWEKIMQLLFRELGLPWEQKEYPSRS